MLSTPSLWTFENFLSETNQSSFFFFFWCKCFTGDTNKTKPNQNKHTVFPHRSPFPGIGYIQNRQSRATTRKASVLEPQAGRRPELAQGRGKRRPGRSPPLGMLLRPLSQQVIQDHPSLTVALLLFLKELHLYILDNIVRRNVFPKSYCFKSNHFWKQRILFNFLKCSSTTNSQNTIKPIFTAS